MFYTKPHAYFFVCSFWEPSNDQCFLWIVDRQTTVTLTCMRRGLMMWSHCPRYSLPEAPASVVQKARWYTFFIASVVWSEVFPRAILKANWLASEFGSNKCQWPCDHDLHAHVLSSTLKHKCYLKRLCTSIIIRKVALSTCSDELLMVFFRWDCWTTAQTHACMQQQWSRGNYHSMPCTSTCDGDFIDINFYSDIRTENGCGHSYILLYTCLFITAN